MPSQTHQSFCVGKPNWASVSSISEWVLNSMPSHGAGGVKHGADRALCDQFGIELLERAGGGVAGVGEGFFTPAVELVVDGVEFLDGHVSLAAHFEQSICAERRRLFVFFSLRLYVCC